ncbi:hypothetical protein HK102_007181, partial [Quaeritorhiza haematococci]
MVTKLLNAGADVHFDGEKLLAEACKRGRENLVKLFLENGADPNGGNDRDKPLHIDVFPALCTKSTPSASESLQTIDDAKGILKLLAKAGADLAMNDNQLLMEACAGGHTDMVKALLSEGANARARNGQALVLAAKGGHLQTVKTLLHAGVDVQVSLKESDTDVMALSDEYINNYQAVFSLLKD